MVIMGVPALVAGIVVVLSHSLPHQIGLIMAAIAGVVAGFSVEQLSLSLRERLVTIQIRLL